MSSSSSDYVKLDPKKAKIGDIVYILFNNEYKRATIVHPLEKVPVSEGVTVTVHVDDEPSFVTHVTNQIYRPQEYIYPHPTDTIYAKTHNVTQRLRPSSKKNTGIFVMANPLTSTTTRKVRRSSRSSRSSSKGGKSSSHHRRRQRKQRK